MPLETPPGLTLKAAGDPILYSDTADLQSAANAFYRIASSADSTTTSTSMGDITGLSFPVVSGSVYVFNLHLFYTVGGTSTGLVIGYTAPGSNDGRMLTEIFNSSGGDTAVTDWTATEDDTSIGTSTTDSTGTRSIRAFGRILAAGTGTFQFRFARKGTSTTVTVLKGSGGSVIVT